jgi:hypothetical protein
VLALGRKQIAPLAGLAGGGIFLALLSYVVSGQELCSAWLRCLALSDKIYSDPAQGVAVHLATSLPRAILLSQPVAHHPLIKPWVYLLVIVLLLLGLGATVKLAKGPLEEADKLKYSFILGALALPTVVPHLFIYDLGALVPAGWVLFFEKPKPGEEILNQGFRGIVLLLWFSITAYSAALVTNVHIAQPLLLVAIMLVSYLAAIIVVLRSR